MNGMVTSSAAICAMAMRPVPVDASTGSRISSFLCPVPRLQPGHGKIHVASSTVQGSELRTASYQYPLKLITTSPRRANSVDPCTLVHTIYLLTYGGGLLAGDRIDLDIDLDHLARLVLQTQGTTKVFRAANIIKRSVQMLRVRLAPGSALCYLPDPAQPYVDSAYEQRQVYECLSSSNTDALAANLCILDWVVNGRSANGENWSSRLYRSCNEVVIRNSAGGKRLLLRDSVLFRRDDRLSDATDFMSNLSVCGSLFVCGPLLAGLITLLLQRYQSLPRLNHNGRGEAPFCHDDNSTVTERFGPIWPKQAKNVFWSVSFIRGVLMVKFGSQKLESCKEWLYSILKNEGSIAREFGERALMCLRSA